jgi:hypothetical protein
MMSRRSWWRQTQGWTRLRGRINLPGVSRPCEIGVVWCGVIACLLACLLACSSHILGGASSQCLFACLLAYTAYVCWKILLLVWMGSKNTKKTDFHLSCSGLFLMVTGGFRGARRLLNTIRIDLDTAGAGLTFLRQESRFGAVLLSTQQMRVPRSAC